MATKFPELMRVQQLTPAEFLKISQMTGRRGRRDIPSFGLAERERELETARICTFCGVKGATRNSRDAHGPALPVPPVGHGIGDRVETVSSGWLNSSAIAGWIGGNRRRVRCGLAQD